MRRFRHAAQALSHISFLDGVRHTCNDRVIILGALAAMVSDPFAEPLKSRPG
jgi:hypothetical protein